MVWRVEINSRVVSGSSRLQNSDPQIPFPKIETLNLMACVAGNEAEDRVWQEGGREGHRKRWRERGCGYRDVGRETGCEGGMEGHRERWRERGCG